VEAVVVENRWGTNRLEAFSDGVFAIAITLLVLDIRVLPSEFDNLWHGIAHAWPEYLAYATSFVTIGGFWLVHHGIPRLLLYANARVMQVNILVLMAVAFLPFPTRLVAEAIQRRCRAHGRGLLRPLLARDPGPPRHAPGGRRARPLADQARRV